ncbi:MAG: phosphoribosylglycinamide formyltransferase [Sulfuritalea sp.]|jgi:phosphoribosylglycinamide formyltransferase-1|nr:phosphoribosylglycinamide formyltransferase [Polynucleobacter sp.]MCF8187259.1 phosphoribosylglycinamide formyltransferase [Sulfuritalea sp.]
MKRIVILISGRGSNMQAMLKVAAAEHWPAQFAAVISNQPNAAGLDVARAAGIATAAINHRDYPDREQFDAALAELIDQHSPDLIVLAGFMRILTPGFVNRFFGRLINIHPSLLPSFPGLHTHQQAIDAGVKVHGATVHFVTAELDHGPIISQATVPVLDDDTEDTLAARVLEQEHRIYPQAVRDLMSDTLKLVDGRVVRSAGK